jgi:NAD(P)-dependent dehydrogenase (short-subunit alcohol dehydrogenase family)
LHGFTKALALEVARKGVTVNTISPGYIGTKIAFASLFCRNFSTQIGVRAATTVRRC